MAPGIEYQPLLVSTRGALARCAPPPPPPDGGADGTPPPPRAPRGEPLPEASEILREYSELAAAREGHERETPEFSAAAAVFRRYWQMRFEVAATRAAALVALRSSSASSTNPTNHTLPIWALSTLSCYI